MSGEFSLPVRAVLLAAGQGKRMKSSVAKVLHPVLGRPILDRVIDALAGLPLEHLHVIVGHGADQLEAHLQRCSPRLAYSTHLQEPQLGTGHALMQAVPALEGFRGTLLVSVADAPLLTPGTLCEFVRTHQSERAVISLLTTEVPDARSYGRIVRDSDGKIARIVEDKDASAGERAIREINPAIYCMEWPAVAEGLSGLSNDNSQKEYYLTDLIAWSRSRGLKLSSSTTDWKEVSAVNSRKELAEAERLLRDRVVEKLFGDGVTVVDPASTWVAPEATIGPDTTLLPGCLITGEVAIGAGCIIGPHTQIIGPSRIGASSQIMQSVVNGSQIGARTRVGPFAHIRDGATIDDSCRIGNFVEVKLSHVSTSTNVSHLSYIGDATLGKNVNIGAGTITANYDKLSGRKSQTVIGDNSSTGSNSVLVAPLVIGTNSMVAAGTVVTRDVPDGSLAVGRARQDNKEGWVDKRLSRLRALM